MSLRAVVIYTFFVIWTPYVFGIDDTPPRIDGSYHAVGEISWKDEEGSYDLNSFEENFDLDSRRSSYSLSFLGLKVTFFEDMKLNQTLKYDSTGCKVFPGKDWSKIHGPPDLEMYEVSGDRIMFPLMQLFWGLQDGQLKDSENRTFVKFRDAPAVRWVYALNYTSKIDGTSQTLDIEAYWSDGSWTGPAKQAIAPLGFIIHRSIYNETSGTTKKVDQYINIFYFVQNYFKKDAFEPKQGVYCPNRKNSRPFPKFPDLKTLSLNLEHVWPNLTTISSVDMWIDSTNNLAQVQYDRHDQGRQPGVKKRATSIFIASNKQGREENEDVLYEIIHKDEPECKISPVKGSFYDPQTIYDIGKLSTLTTDILFGGKVNYIYIGETIKRGIPCRMWQGVRKNWPPDAPFIITLWEWCIAERVGNPMMFREGTVPIVSLDVKVLESTLTEAEGIYTNGVTLSYNFYNMYVRDPVFMKAVAFDITPCFDDSLKDPLQFSVEVKPDKTKIVENATRDVEFIDKWRTTIYGASNLRPSSLRVARIKMIMIKTTLYVQFLLLDKHPDLPSYVEGISSEEAKSILKKFIDTDSLAISWDKNVTELLVLKATQGSLQRQFDVKRPPETKSSPEEPETEKTTKETKTEETEFVFTDQGTLPTKETFETPNSTLTQTTGSGSTGGDGTTPTPNDLKQPAAGYQPSTMAGVGISLLLIGVSLGAGGTFVKFRYYSR